MSERDELLTLVQTLVMEKKTIHRVLSEEIATLREQVERMKLREAHPCIENPCDRCREATAAGMKHDHTHYGEKERWQLLDAENAKLREQVDRLTRENEHLRERIERQASWLRWPTYGAGLNEENETLRSKLSAVKVAIDELAGIAEWSLGVIAGDIPAFYNNQTLEKRERIDALRKVGQ